MSEAKPYDISKQLVWEAYQRVKANRGAAGVDGVSLAAFEKDLKGNLYKVWNRMSSGSYHPPPVRLVEIPKDNGGTRPLGIPTVADRVAQTIVKMVLEPLVEPQFHPDSYGYRPGRSALDAVGMARKRCWEIDWVIDLDIKAFFDSIPHDLVERAVAHHTDLAWVRLYIGRWLRAPVECPDGTLVERTKGTPQGGVVSPLLANLFLHYALDRWMDRNYPSVRFERYADAHRPLQEQGGSSIGAGSHPRSLRRMRPGASSREDQDRVLQGRRPAGEPRTYQVRLPRLHLSTSTREESLGEVFYRLPAGDQQQGRQGDPADHSRVANGVHQEQPAAGGSGSPDQPGGAGMDELLRAVLPLEVHSSAPSPQ